MTPAGSSVRPSAATLTRVSVSGTCLMQTTCSKRHLRSQARPVRRANAAGSQCLRQDSQCRGLRLHRAKKPCSRCLRPVNRRRSFAAGPDRVSRHAEVGIPALRSALSPGCALRTSRRSRLAQISSGSRQARASRSFGPSPARARAQPALLGDQLGEPAAAVVVGRHRRAVRASVQDGDQVAALERRQRDVGRERVAAFAHRPDDGGGLRRVRAAGAPGRCGGSRRRARAGSGRSCRRRARRSGARSPSSTRRFTHSTSATSVPTGATSQRPGSKRHSYGSPDAISRALRRGARAGRSSRPVS